VPFIETRVTSAEQLRDNPPKKPGDSCSRGGSMCRPLITTVLLAAVVGVSSCGWNNTPRPILSLWPVTQPGPVIEPAPVTQPSAASISSVSPAAAVAGSADLTVTVTGSGFQPYNNHIVSFAVWVFANGDTELATKYVRDTQLTAVIPAKLLATPSSPQLLVVNGDLMGWGDGYRGYPKSNAVLFSVIAP
jgi:hypothetical protein